MKRSRFKSCVSASQNSCRSFMTFGKRMRRQAPVGKGEFRLASVPSNTTVRVYTKSQKSKKSNYFIVRPKVDQRAGQLSLPHLVIF